MDVSSISNIFEKKWTSKVEDSKVQTQDQKFQWRYYGESIQKRQFFSIILVFVSDPGSMSPFLRDELLTPVLYFVFVDQGERGKKGA